MKTPLPEPAFINRHPPEPLPTKYYTEAQLRAAMRDAFNEGIEEAAKVAETAAHKLGGYQFAADAILKLKEQA